MRGEGERDEKGRDEDTGASSDLIIITPLSDVSH
jgi:hypothetical protein